MAAEIKKEQSPAKSSERGNEIVAVVVTALALLVFLCLVTYSPQDWNLNTASEQKTQNWIGIFGAIVSDLLFQAVGLTAYIVPALLALAAWRIYRSKTIRPPVSRVFGYLFFIISASSLIHLIGWHGGLTGAFFAKYMTWLLGTIGATIIFLAIFAASTLVITNLSFGVFSESFEMAIANLRLRISDWRDKRRRAGGVYVEENNSKQKRAKPAITVSEKVEKEKTKTAAVGGKLMDVFGKLGKSSDAEKTEAAAEIIEEEETAEEITPTISGAETIEKPEIEIKKDIEIPDLVAESEKIPITPIKETGELDADLLEIPDEAEEVTEKKVFEPQKPQNFDDYILPLPEFLTEPSARLEQKDEELLNIAQNLTEKTKEFNVTGRVMHICQGPVVTTYEFKPDPGVKYSRVTGLVDDLCLALKAESIRIDRIPGKAFVGIEVPNRERETIHLREVIESKKFKDSESVLALALGKQIDGLNYVADLAKMPHLLIAGATGAGKSVGVNSIVVSILYKAKPDEVKFIMVDPKRLELGLYADIPHLATPIITDPKRAAISLKWAVSEMEKRYKDLAGWGVRNIDGFNKEVRRRKMNGELDEEGEEYKVLPYIVIIIDELADLMMTSGKEVEESITRLAQMARAVGIHLILATQRPSVDVITGLIKANFPSRISFRVSSKIDSRTIIDGNGAESLLGRGDMLFLPPQTSRLIRVHGAYVDEKEIHKIVEHIKAQANPEYDETITKSEEELNADGGVLPGRNDDLFWEAVRTIIGAKKASTSLLQRHLRIGYGRAAAILDAMVAEGFIGADVDGATRARPILPKAYEELDNIDQQGG